MKLVTIAWDLDTTFVLAQSPEPGPDDPCYVVDVASRVLYGPVPLAVVVLAAGDSFVGVPQRPDWDGNPDTAEAGARWDAPVWTVDFPFEQEPVASH